MTFRFGVWLFEICIRIVFFGIFYKLVVSKGRWITSTRWFLQCFWYICGRVQLKSDINNVIKGVVFYNDLQNISYASISSPANPPRHPITDKLRTTVSQPSVWLPLRHMDWVQKWKYIDFRCFLYESLAFYRKSYIFKDPDCARAPSYTCFPIVSSRFLQFSFGFL